MFLPTLYITKQLLIKLMLYNAIKSWIKKKINNISRKKNGDLNSSLFSIPAAKQTLQQQQYCGKSETVRVKADTTKRALMVYKHLL